jgi:N-acetylneuraminic acid mutarotase
VWQSFGSLPQTMWGEGAAQLPSGSVVVFGMVTGKSHVMSAQTSLVDPATGAITAGPSMLSTQAVPGVATLADGSVFAAGGWGGTNGLYPSAAAEILDAATGTWRSLPLMNMPRSQATVTALADGGVLVAGGSAEYLSGNARVGREQVTSSAEIYYPAMDFWQPAGNMPVPRSAQSAALLPNGNVLVAGGWSNGLQHGTSSVDVYSPASGWANAPAMPGGHCQARMVTLPGGRLLEIGGNDARGDTTTAVELFDPAKGVWQRTGSLQQPLYWPAAVTLRDGRVLVAGGSGNSAISNRLEIYIPSN